MPTTPAPPKSRSASSAPSRAGGSLGPWVAAWIERNVVHGEGDFAGKPFVLRPFQRDFLNRCYEIDGAGRRRYDRVVLGLPKGNGKTPLAAAIALAELDGPVVFNGWDAQGRPKATRRTSPDIPVAAASFEQADLLFGDCAFSAKHGPLADRLDAFETEILLKDHLQLPGSLYKVAAVAGTNDGKRPTFFGADEVHEWEGKKERVHLVLSNGRAKRADAWELSISTAGWDGESLLAKLYRRGKAGTDPRFLLVWHEADPSLDLENADQRRQAIAQANPAAGDFLSFEAIEARYHEIDEHEFRRYYLNQWTSVPEQWMAPEVWDDAATPTREVPQGAAICLGFDGSYNQDATALIGCTIEHPHLFEIGVWARPEKVKDWTVDEAAVESAILDTVARYQVVGLPADDTFGRIWQKALGSLVDKGIPVIEWPTRSPARMAPACGQFWGALKRKALTHDGSPTLRHHVMNCRTKTDRYGPRIVKDHKNSDKHIDAAVAAVIAYDAVVRNENVGSVYDTRDVRVL